MTIRLYSRAELDRLGPHDLSPDAVALIEWGDLDIEICADGSTVVRDGETGALLDAEGPKTTSACGQ